MGVSTEDNTLATGGQTAEPVLNEPHSTLSLPPMDFSGLEVRVVLFFFYFFKLSFYY